MTKMIKIKKVIIESFTFSPRSSVPSRAVARQLLGCCKIIINKRTSSKSSLKSSLPLEPVSILVLEFLDVGLHVGDLLLLRQVVLQQLLVLLKDDHDDNGDAGDHED